MESYLQPIKDFLKKNELYLEESEFISLQYEITDKMEADKIGFDAIKSILELMETNPLVEFGTPGPLTHFMEKFYNENKEDYENLLKQSVQEKPTVHTIWLLSRVINGSEKSIELLKILNSISNDNEIQQEIRNVANDFLEYHQGK